MSVPLRSIGRARWSFAGPDQTIGKWVEALPHPTESQRRAEELAAAAELALDGLPPDLIAQVEECVARHWAPRATAGASVVCVLESLTDDSSEPREVVLAGPVVRLGRGDSCHVVLPDDELEAEHCEIFLDESGIRIVDLGSDSGTTLDGEKVPPNEPCEAVSGNVVGLGGYRLRIGDLEPASPVSARLRRGGVLAIPNPEAHPFSALARWWVPLRIGSWRGAVGIGETWIESAYRSLGTSVPENVGLESALDRAVTSFALERMASDLATSAGLPVEVGEPSDVANIPPEESKQPQGWLAASFDVEVDGHVLPSVAAWPAAAAPRQRPAWLSDLRFEVSVLGGFANLEPSELGDLEQGDIVVPDNWLPEATDTQGEAEGAVVIALDRWIHRGNVNRRAENQTLELTAPNWMESPGGIEMLTNKTELTDTAAEGPIESIERELEITLAFELDRVAVPLKELAAWREGATVTLDRTPSDPVRLLLYDGAGARVVGTGTVVVVEDRLGVRLDEWRPEREGVEPA